MNPDIERFLNLRHLPDRLTAAETAAKLGISPHEVPILVAKGLLKPLGHPAVNAPKYFLTATLKDLERDEKWHGKAADAITEYWRHKNARKQDSTDARQSASLQTQDARAGD
ncbi:MAG TPA: hypothetical protein VNN22_16850 [Verrucomicrobiae bacterium]|nr:hypothetical protein [Verrucomicrobiae bacterium]